LARAQASPCKPAKPAERYEGPAGEWLSKLTSPSPRVIPLKRRRAGPRGPVKPSDLSAAQVHSLHTEQLEWHKKTDPFNGDTYYINTQTGREMAYPPVALRVTLSEADILRAREWAQK
jgi:hypothetical protein